MGVNDPVPPQQAQDVSGTDPGVSPTLPTVVTVQGHPSGIPIPVTPTGGAGTTDVNLVEIGGTPVTDPLTVVVTPNPLPVDATIVGGITNPLPIDIAADSFGTLPVGVVNFPATQPVSGSVTAVVSPNPLPVSQSGSWTVGVSGTVAATQSGSWTVAVSGTVAATQSGSWTVTIQDGGGSITVDTPQLPAALVGGRLDVNIGAGSVTAVIGTVPNSSSATVASVNDSATNVTLIASNANRKGASIFNDSDQVLYVKLGATATTTDYSVKMIAGAYYELPVGALGCYTGIIDGIWAANSTGAARTTEW